MHIIGARRTISAAYAVVLNHDAVLLGRGRHRPTSQERRRHHSGNDRSSHDPSLLYMAPDPLPCSEPKARGSATVAPYIVFNVAMGRCGFLPSTMRKTCQTLVIQTGRLRRGGICV